MLSRLATSLWMQEEEQEHQQNHQDTHQENSLPIQETEHHPHHHLMGHGPTPGLPGFRQVAGGSAAASATAGLLDDDWYFDAGGAAEPKGAAFSPNHLQFLTSNSNSSCSNSSLFPLLNAGPANPFDTGASFDLGCSSGGGVDASAFLASTHVSSSPVSLVNAGIGNNGGGGSGGFLAGFGGFGAAGGQLGLPELSGSGAQFSVTCGVPSSGAGVAFGNLGFDVFDNSAAPFVAGRNKMLRPLEMFPPVGAQPTLFQKRAAAAAVRRNAAAEEEEEEGEKRRKGIAEDADDDGGGSIDVSGLNYDSEDVAMENSKGDESGKNSGDGGRREGKDSNANGVATGNAKGKKKGLPAKNLMAERRRRKKLNDRLYMLRSVVPKISKMDRASILGDAIEYLKELLQKINDLHNELESSPSTSSLPPTPTSFHPLTPTLPTLPSRVKDELCPSALPSPTGQQARVEVRVREGRAINIHMFCARRPGLMLSTMRALDGLGLDVQQAVISCFNGFALDVFRAEQCKDGPGLLPDEIKAVLLQSAGFHTVM